MPQDTWTLSVVEGDEAVRESIGALALSNGWGCRTFATARAFLDNPMGGDCLLLDWDLPDAQARRFLGVLRERYPALPVVVMTARDDRPTLARIRAAGAGAVLARPFRFAELRGAVAQAAAASPLGPRRPA